MKLWTNKIHNLRASQVPAWSVVFGAGIATDQLQVAPQFSAAPAGSGQLKLLQRGGVHHSLLIWQ
jgi:hypothetical protein